MLVLVWGGHEEVASGPSMHCETSPKRASLRHRLLMSMGLGKRQRLQ